MKCWLVVLKWNVSICINPIRQRFTVTEKGLRPPLAALGGIGVTAAQSISEAREIGHPFISQEDLRVRAKVGKAVVEKLAEHGALGDLPETDQIDLF